MKLSTGQAARYFATPDPQRSGLLIYGQDAMRVAMKRQQVIAALLGENAEQEMRLTRINAADLRQDPAQLVDALKAQGFFPGPRAVFVEDASDRFAAVIKSALGDWQAGDAQLIVTARVLAARSTLRKCFETHPNAYAAGIFDDPPSPDEIAAELTKAGIRVDADALAALTTLSRTLDPGDFRQTVEKLALYCLDQEIAATSTDVAACAPGSTEADLDDVLNIVAEARVAEIGPVMRRLSAQGTQPVSLCIGATRHFRALHTAASDPGGPSSGVARLRPPVYGPRRDRLVRQAGAWGVHRLEQALGMLIDTDLQLRSTSRAPAMAVIERTLIRLAMLGAAARR